MEAPAPPGVPSPPWRLLGDGLLLVHLIDAETARRVVPHGFRIVQVLPGWTPGGIFLGRYGEGSTMSYHELIVVPALTYARGCLGFWISDIFVDDERSIEGGRRIWGLPKQHASFDWNGDNVTVRHEGDMMLQVHVSQRRPSLRLPLVAPYLSQVDGLPSYTIGRGTASFSAASCSVRISDAAPFGWMNGARRLFTLAMPSLRLQVPAPRPCRRMR